MADDGMAPRLLGATLLVALATSCGSPTEPCSRGSTSGDAIYVTCESAGPDLQCASHFTNKFDLYICAQADQIVTADTVWAVSDPGVGMFEPSRPGLLRAVSSGRVEIFAKYKVHDSIGPVAFFMSPDKAPVELVWLELFVTDEQSKIGIPGADATVTQEGMSDQQCTADSAGRCLSPPARFWVFSTGPVRVVVSKAGYAPSDTTNTYATNSIPYQAKVSLRRDGT